MKQPQDAFNNWCKNNVNRYEVQKQTGFTQSIKPFGIIATQTNNKSKEHSSSQAHKLPSLVRLREILIDEISIAKNHFKD